MVDECNNATSDDGTTTTINNSGQSHHPYCFSLTQNLTLVFSVYFESHPASQTSALYFLSCAKKICSVEQCLFLEYILPQAGKLKMDGRLFDFKHGTIYGLMSKPQALQVCYVTNTNFDKIYSIYCERNNHDDDNKHNDDDDDDVAENNNATLTQTYEQIVQLRIKVHALQTKLATITFHIMRLDHIKYKELKQRSKIIDQVRRSVRRQERQVRKIYGHPTAAAAIAAATAQKKPKKNPFKIRKPYQKKIKPIEVKHCYYE